jgi:hypothetical protein
VTRVLAPGSTLTRSAPSEGVDPVGSTRQSSGVQRLRLAAVLWLSLAPALAHGFHERLACGTCHLRMAGVEGPARLVGRDETPLCLECHQGRDNVPDVMHGGRARRAGDAGRPAGGLNRVGDDPTLAGGYGEGTGHTLGSSAPPPGFDRGWRGPLTCKSCHAVHANGRYRHLGPDPYLRTPAYVEFARSVYDLSALPVARRAPDALPGDVLSGVDVLVPDLAYAADPANAPVFAAAPEGTHLGSAMDRFCASCHPLFHGEENTAIPGGRDFVRHPTGGVPIAGAARDGLDRAAQPPRVSWRDARTAEVGCLTCHRAHGSRHAYGLVWWDRDASGNGEDGAGGTPESLCLTCHRVDEEKLDLPADWPMRR